jgi:ribonuclease D
MTNHLYQDDIPADLIKLEGDLAIDCETRGLDIFNRDRLCVIQISNGDGNAHLVQFKDAQYDKAKNLKKLISDNNRQYIFHYARFDIAAISLFLGVDIRNIFCTKISSKLIRTYTDKHSLKYLAKEILGIELSKQQQCSDWANELSEKQIEYAASDVLYLHQIRGELKKMLQQENRMELAQKCFDFLPTRVELDKKGWLNDDIFSHGSS